MEDNNNDNIDEIISVGLKATNFDNIIERYFYKIYLNKGEDKEQFIFLHSNGIVLCGLGENHFLIKYKSILNIKDLGKLVEVKGKRKHGAKILQENESIIEIKYFLDNKEMVYKFCPGVIKAKLMEVNQNVLNNISILYNSPEKFGYLCMLYLDLKQIDSLKSKYPIDMREYNLDSI